MLQVRNSMRFHCADALVALRICTPKREHWSSGSLRDLITATVNLNRKLGYFKFPEGFREWFSRRGNCRPQSGKILKYIVRLLEKFQATVDHFEELKPCFASLVNPFNVKCISDGCLVH